MSARQRSMKVGCRGRDAAVAQDRSTGDGAQAAQRRADSAGANTERNRQWLRYPAADDPSDERQPESPSGPAPERRDRRGQDRAGGRPWADTGSRPADGTAYARDQAARMHDSAASLHDEAVRLGIGDSDEHRRSAARHREAATSHRPTVRRTPESEVAPSPSGQSPDGAA